MTPTVPELEAAVERKVAIAQSEAALYAKTLFRLRNALLGVVGDAQDEGDRVYFGSSNDFDRLKAVSQKIDDLMWDDIMASSQPPVDLYQSIEDRLAEIAALKEALAVSEARREELEGALVIYQRLRGMIQLIGDDENAKGYNEALELFASVDQQATALLNPQQEGSRDHGR